MKKFSTVETAVDLAVAMMEANHMISDTNSVRVKVYSWYEHSDVTDPKMLAGCALEIGFWFPGATYADMQDSKDIWFPEVDDPYSNIAVWEIEPYEERWW